MYWLSASQCGIVMPQTSRALGWAHLKVCSSLSAGHLPQTLQKQSCKNHQGLKSLLLLSPQYTVLHILFHCTFTSYFLCYFYFILTYIYIYSLVLCFIFIFILLHCPLSGPVLIYISLLIISCIIAYMTNKITLNLEPTWSKKNSLSHACVNLSLVKDLNPCRQDTLLVTDCGKWNLNV